MKIYYCQGGCAAILKKGQVFKKKKISIKMTYLAVVCFPQLSRRLLSHFKAFQEELPTRER